MVSKKPINEITPESLKGKRYQTLLDLHRAYQYKMDHGTTSNKAMAARNVKTIQAAMPKAREEENHRFWR